MSMNGSPGVSPLVLVAGFIAGALTGCGGSKDSSPPGKTGAITFWQDVAPIYNDKCVRCHQEGGIGPFRLDNFADAESRAPLELARVTDGTMPPYFMVHDGSCGSFHDETTLTAAEKATIAGWGEGGRQEGTPVALTLPPQPKLNDAVELMLPTFSPVAQGGQLALFDEYRCFVMDAPTATNTFLTAYDVTPGDPSIVHHVIAFIVDPNRVGRGGVTNGALMQALDNQSPDRAGWPCFGGAGDGISPSAEPVAWAPGQGIVEYPQGMGIPLHPADKLVIQVHYNLADVVPSGAPVAKTDTTAIHLRFAPTVTRQLAFLLPDPFLDSLGNATPDSLPPRQRNTAYTWTRTGRQLGVSAAVGVDLVGVVPHMHQRGVRQQLNLGGTCAAHLEKWDFHWQEFYFYKTYPHITPTTPVEVTCEYNTFDDAEAVLPGWGTRNEMCLTVLMVAL